MDVLNCDAAKLHPAKLGIALAALLITGLAAAQGTSEPDTPPRTAAPPESWQVFVAAGQSVAHGSDSENLFIGLMVPRHAPRPLGRGTLTTYWEAFGGQWRGPDRVAQEKSYSQIGALISARLRFGNGTNPWFLDGGFGLAYMDGLYEKPGRVFSTRWNFLTRVGLGRSFGAQGAHELSLNVQHLSNAGLKKPNPGEDFVQVRYGYRF
jgi:lipid A 3-O-deacylase